MQVHLVDATYELFRAHFSPRPPVRGRDRIVLSGVSGLVEQLCYLVREPMPRLQEEHRRYPLSWRHAPVVW